MTLARTDCGGRFGTLARGAWDWFVYGGWKGQPVRKVPALRCPRCDRLFCLADHVVQQGGRVSPSVVCPYNCGYHEFVQLAGF